MNVIKNKAVHDVVDRAVHSRALYWEVYRSQDRTVSLSVSRGVYYVVFCPVFWVVSNPMNEAVNEATRRSPTRGEWPATSL